jgi:ABC-type uncharacterized transport system YnjBCD substrate-binding protein
MGLKQPELLQKVKEERDYQDKRWGGDWTDNSWSAADWIAFIEKYKSNAMVAAINGEKDEFVKQMVKVAALAVAAAEAAERKGEMKK